VFLLNLALAALTFICIAARDVFASTILFAVAAALVAWMLWTFERGKL
jgi:hypothetical protein